MIDRPCPRATLAVLVVLGAFASACSESNAPSAGDRAAGPPVVYAVNYPLAYFAERVAGDAADVRFPAPADGDPAFWEPGDADVSAMQSGDLILLNGATYAKWLDHVSLPASKTVDTSRAFADRYIEIESGATHSHGDGADHSHAGTAFTTWLDMRQARAQVEAVRDALAAAAPDAAADLERNASALLADIDALDAELAGVTRSIGARPLVASHPVYQYFARRYGLDIGSVMWEPETVPDDAAMVELQDLLADHPAKWMIWEGEPDPASVARLDAIGVRSVVFDPCGNRPDAGDWLAVMRANVENLRRLLE